MNQVSATVIPCLSGSSQHHQVAPSIQLLTFTVTATRHNKLKKCVNELNYSNVAFVGSCNSAKYFTKCEKRWLPWQQPQKKMSVVRSQCRLSLVGAVELWVINPHHSLHITLMLSDVTKTFITLPKQSLQCQLHQGWVSTLRINI